MSAPDKRALLERCLASGLTMLHLDARVPGVQVPAHLAAEPHLRLNLSRRFLGIDLQLDGERVAATLSFGSRPFRCLLPWRALFGLTLAARGQTYVFPDAVPAEARAAWEAELGQALPQAPAEAAVASAARPSDDPGARAAAAGRPHLRVLPGGKR